MGHHIQAIVTADAVGDKIVVRYPQLPRVTMNARFLLLPVNEDFVDSLTQPRPSQTPIAFMLLTDPFCELLRELSGFGMLAYIETDYTAGKGGQGAVVYSHGEVVMKPTWANAGVINAALKLLGVRRGLLSDRFTVFGLSGFRSNDDLLDAASVQIAKT